MMPAGPVSPWRRRKTSPSSPSNWWRWIRAACAARTTAASPLQAKSASRWAARSMACGPMSAAPANRAMPSATPPGRNTGLGRSDLTTLKRIWSRPVQGVLDCTEPSRLGSCGDSFRPLLDDRQYVLLDVPHHQLSPQFGVGIDVGLGDVAGRQSQFRHVG